MAIQSVIRVATPADNDAIADVMFDAVRNGRSEYSEEQRRAWVPRRRTGSGWNERLNSQAVFVGETSDTIMGFMSLATCGYIDLAFIRPIAQGTGLFRRLYNAIENLSRQQGESRLWVHASLTAQPAFAAMGFKVTTPQKVTIGDEVLERFEMEKRFVDA